MCAWQVDELLQRDESRGQQLQRLLELQAHHHGGGSSSSPNNDQQQTTGGGSSRGIGGAAGQQQDDEGEVAAPAPAAGWDSLLP